MIDSLLLIFALYALFALWEGLMPAQDGQGLAGRLRNVVLTTLLVVVGGIVVAVLYVYAPVRTEETPDRSVGGSLLMLAAYVFVADFLFYWYHRAQHRFAWLWPIHELHHSDAELNGTTSLRTYWLDKPVQAMVISVPAARLIGLDHLALVILPVALTAWLVFAHANVRLRLGWLSPVICGPQVHRIHHSIEPQHRDRNFAQFFPVIDVIFGTYYAPAPDEFPRTGTPGLASDAPLSTMLVRPARLWWEARPLGRLRTVARRRS
jgi:sterol desaturase/sphingolipid hydroxylase (fatty acid hydroxylase superfamily)